MFMIDRVKFSYCKHYSLCTDTDKARGWDA